MKKYNVTLEEASEHTDDTIPIYWDDLTKQKQEEILAAFGDNCNYDVFPIVEIPAAEDRTERNEVDSDEE